MKTSFFISFLVLIVLALQQTNAFLPKDFSKLWGKLLKIDGGSEEAPTESKEENFFTLIKDTKEKFFNEIPNTFKNIFKKFEHKIEKKVDKIEEEKEDFDAKILKFFEEKKRFKNLFKDLIDEKIEKIDEEIEEKFEKKENKKPVVEDPYYTPATPKPVVYKPKPKTVEPPKYAPESAETYVKPKHYAKPAPVPPKYLPKSAEVEEPYSAEAYVKPKSYVHPAPVLPKYIPKSAEVEEPYSEEEYAKSHRYAPAPKALPCSGEYIPEPRLVRLPAPEYAPENVYYFTK